MLPTKDMNVSEAFDLLQDRYCFVTCEELSKRQPFLTQALHITDNGRVVMMEFFADGTFDVRSDYSLSAEALNSKSWEVMYPAQPRAEIAMKTCRKGPYTKMGSGPGPAPSYTQQGGNGGGARAASMNTNTSKPPAVKGAANRTYASGSPASRRG